MRVRVVVCRGAPSWSPAYIAGFDPSQTIPFFLKRISIALFIPRPVFRGAWHPATAGAILSSSNSSFSRGIHSHSVSHSHSNALYLSIHSHSVSHFHSN